ncbi:MAG TPA: hypothetical protein VIA06_17255 [Candidatus Dormibacteraeota bacterium]|nr:hypothetical protein [Candidatus Dormibacteraeota bacterium]
MPSLVQLYRRLFFTYPEEYRRAREAEMLATLLDAAAPGQHLPGLREAAGLIAGGVRTRARIGPAGGPRAIWGQGLRLGAALAIASMAAVALLPLSYPGDLWSRLLPLALAATVVALLRWPGRYGLALVALDALAAWPHGSAALVAVNGFAVFVAVHGFAAWPQSPAILLTSSGLWWLVETAVPLALAAAAFAWHPSAGPAGRPLPGWVIALVLILPVGLELSLYRGAYDAMEAIVGARVPISLFVLVLPAAILGFLSLLLRSPIPALGATIYLISDLTCALTQDLALPPQVIYNGPALALALGLIVASAGITALSRRPARA